MPRSNTARVRRLDVSASGPLIAEQLRHALNAVPTHAWYALPSGALVFVNERAADYGGLPSDHPLRFGIDTGASWDLHIQYLHPEDHEETRRNWSQCLKTETGSEVSVRIRNALGEYRWFISRAEPFRDSAGKILYWIGVNLDVEAHKQTEFYLTEGQRLAHTGSWALDATGFTYWSPQLFEIYGLDPAGKPPSVPEFIALVQSEDRDFVERVIQRMLSDHRAADLTKRIIKPNGTIRHVRCVGVPVPNGGFLGTAVDVTEQEELARALRAGEEQLRQVLDLTPQNIAVLGPGSERLYLNRTALEYHGITLDEWRARRRGSEVHPDDRAPFQSKWDRALLEGSGFETEVRLRKSDGTYRWFLARHNLVRDSDGRILRWHVGCTDIEDRKQHEESLQLENAALRAEISQSSMFDEIVGSSGPLRMVLATLDKVARTDATVLIMGETGTGKELIARAIHRRSKRTVRPFVGVNCGAIPTSLVASELFGHEKGSFTGATQRHLGRFEAANGGTIFLDEVGDLPPDVQIALLRVLQEREIERVGGNRPIPVDVRVLAATHHDLEKLVGEGKFRKDLFYRLNVVPITMPPLRERATDIPVLAEYFIERISKRVGKKFGRIIKGTMEILQAYSWPGNVRELQNVIERAITLSDSDTFVVDEAWLPRQPANGNQPAAPLNGALLAHEKEAIEVALAECRGRLSGPTGAAEKLGVPVSTLDSKIKRLGIDKNRFKSG